MGHAKTKLQYLDEARRLFLTDPHGLTDTELAQALAIDRSSAYRYRKELDAVLVPGSRGRYTLIPNEEDIKLAKIIIERAGQ